MSTVTFPGLGLSFEISKIAIEILDIPIYWYAIFIVSGIVLGLFLSYISKEKFEVEFENFVDLCVTTIIAGIIGARLYYVVFNLEYYMQDPISILAFRDGGLAIYGGLILGGLALIIRARMLELNPLDVLDYMIPYVALAQSIGRWGNFFNMEAYGTAYNGLFRMGLETADGYIEVHPTFLYESIATFVIFCILRILQKNRKFKGQVLLTYMMSYSFVRFLIEGLRADSLMFMDFRVSQLVSVAIFILGTYLYSKFRKSVKNK